jgi:hypothetical protein
LNHEPERESDTTQREAARGGTHLAFVSTGELGRMKEGLAPYVNRGEALGLSRSGWAWDAKLDDFDNDGVLEALQATGFIRGDSNRWPELQELGTVHDQLTSNVVLSWPLIKEAADISGRDRNPFFVRAGDRCVDVSREIGFGEDYVSRGLAVGDVDYDGALDPSVRRAICDGLEVPEPLGAYVRKVVEHAHTVGDEDIAGLHRAGYTDDQIFEATVCAALGAGLYRLGRILLALRPAS